MIELNLLPQEARKKRKLIEIPEVPLVPIATGFIGILVIIQLLLGGLIFISKKRLVALKRTWQAMAPEKKELDTIKQSILNANKKIQAIDSLVEKRLSWARLLNEISNSLTPNIWLTELSYAEKIVRSKTEGTLRMSGSASVRGEEATRNIARFIKALKVNKNFFKDFEDVELVSMKKGSRTSQELMNFTLACKFKPKS